MLDSLRLFAHEVMPAFADVTGQATMPRTGNLDVAAARRAAPRCPPRGPTWELPDAEFLQINWEVPDEVRSA